MFYRHWKKIALSLTALFWAGCDDSASSAVCLYGPNPNYSDPAENPVSSSSVTGAPESSSDEGAGSSSSIAESSSSEMMQIVPDYGVSYNPDEKDTVFTYETLCFNDSAENVEGRVFKIINCTDGSKYLRNPGDAGYEGVELPEGVQVFAPEAGSEKAHNCTRSLDVCIERDPSKPIEQDSLAGCHPTIDCPEKPSNVTYETLPKKETRS